MCSEFVTPQKNVLLTTLPNLNDEKNGQVYKVRFQNRGKISSILCSETLGACLRHRGTIAGLPKKSSTQKW